MNLEQGGDLPLERLEGEIGELDTTISTIGYVPFPFMHHVLCLVVLCFVFG